MMEVNFFLFLTFLEGMTDFAAFAAKEGPSSRTACFTTQENKRLLGHVVKQFESESLMSCSQLCLRRAWCTSTNFIMSSKKDDKGTCELNKNDISPSDEDSEFHEQEGVTFSRLLKVRCYDEIIITLFRRIFITTGVRYHYSGYFTDFSLQSFTSADTR